MGGGRWLNAAAIGTWLACGLGPLVRLADGRLAGWSALIWVVSFLAYGAALTVFLCITHPSSRADRRHSFVAMIAMQSATGLTMVFLSPDGLAAATLVIVAAELPYFVRARTAWSWVGVQTLALGAIFGRYGWSDALTAGVALGGFQLFALTSSFLALSERAAREALARTNAELHSTRGLLAENSRVAERLRISRDLHDTLGHHLTALSLQLDVASRLADGKAAEHVTQAHAITRLLLSDVRDVVGQLRDSRRFDLAQAIRELAESSRDLEIHLDVPDALAVDDSSQAHALLRCVQEIITNTTRHSSARNLWIGLELRAGGIELHARDDGRGAGTLEWGNGLTGMRERFEEHAGRVEFATESGRGFEVHGFMPGPSAAT